MSAAIEKEESTLLQKLVQFFLFDFSDKFKFASKAALSIAIVFLVSFSQGWVQASTAAITIMLIAAMGSVGDSISKGMYRVIGTIVGAILGMTLIALFPQDRFHYLLALSVLVTAVLYLTRAYRGDNTVFMLTAMTLMAVFKNGEVDEVFLYGMDKTFMTVFGIAVYTLVGVFLWPVNLKDNSAQNAIALSKLQAKIYKKGDVSREEASGLQHALLREEQLLKTSHIASDNATMTMNFSMKQWQDIILNYQKIDELLTLLLLHKKLDLSYYVENYATLDREILQLQEAIPNAWEMQKEIKIPQTFEVSYKSEIFEALSPLERADIGSIANLMQRLHSQLTSLSQKLNSLISPMPTLFSLEKQESYSAFSWFDIEDIKGSLLTFIIFWAAVALWIYLNPPGGFMVVMLATGLSVITVYSPIKPSLLMIVFTFSFIFATLMYIFVLPQLSYGWELGVFLFLYAFIGFYFIKPQISIFFLLGIMILGLANEMYYNFAIFLLILFVFYLFLFILLFFYYIPFSMKPEYLFLTMKRRFFKLSKNLLLQNKRRIFTGKIAAKYSKMHLTKTLMKMKLWANKIDENYFDMLNKKSLMAFVNESETFGYLILLLHQHDKKVQHNLLLQAFRKKTEMDLATLLCNHDTRSVSLDKSLRDEKRIIEEIDQELKIFFETLKLKEYSQIEFR